MGGSVLEKRKKVCFAASSGGHFDELMMLKPLMEKYDSFIVTEETPYDVDLGDIRSYRIPRMECGEKPRFSPAYKGALECLKIFLCEKPDVIICIGSMAVVPLCLIGRLCGRKLVCFEPFGCVTYPSRAGRLLYRYADRFFVHWPQMLQVYPDAIYVGGFFGMETERRTLGE